MASWSIRPFLSNMEDAAFDAFKREFVQTHRYFTKSENNPVLSAVYAILFSEKHFSLLDCKELSDLIDALFASAMKDINWLARYMDELLTYLPKDNDAKKIGYEGRSDKYYKHVHDTLPKRFKSGLKEGRDLADEDMWETIRDQIRIVFALRNQWKKVSADANVIEDVDLTLNSNETADDLFFNEHPQPQSADEKKMLGIKLRNIVPLQVLPAHSMNGSDKQLAILITRALLCDLHSDITDAAGEE